MIKAVFFDIWDTLVTSRKIPSKERPRSPLMEFLDSIGHKKTEEEVNKLFEEVHDYLESMKSVERYKYGMGLSLLFERLGVEVDKGTVDSLEDKMLDSWIGMAEKRPDADELLTWLKEKGYKLAVISNWDVKTANKMIDAFDLRKYFDSVIISEEVGGEKSSTIPFRVALGQLGLKPEEAVMVGDREDEDVLGAKLVGMKAIKVPGSHPVFGETRKADYEIRDLIELKEILGKRM